MRGKYKSQRGRPRHFTSAQEDPDAYIRNHPTRRPQGDNGDTEDEKGATSDSEESSTLVGDSSVDSNSSPSGEEEEETNTSYQPISSATRGLAKLQVSKSTSNTMPSTQGTASGSTLKNDKPRELSRREREAIERERARQHFLKMKEREDAARLAVIRKRREEEAAKHAAEQKAKEEARFNRR